MPYNITLTDGTDLITGGLLDNTIDNSNSSLVLVGKNYKSYGIFLNQNFVRLMENFALASAPPAPIPGQLWFNSSSKLLNVNIATTKGTASAIWKTIAGMTISATTPTNSFTGEQWYDTTNGQLRLYTGTEWRLIGPLNKLSTGNSGAIPDTVPDAPPSTTYVVIKFFIDNVLVGIWSKDGPFTSDVSGFSTIKKGLNLHSSLGHTFWGNSEVANNLYVNGVAVAGNAFLRGDVSSTINGSLTLTNDAGVTFGAANDFVGNVVNGTVILKNQTNNKDLVLSVKSAGNQTPFFRGNSSTGLAEAYNNPTAQSPSLSFATKQYVDTLAGAVSGEAVFFGNIVPSSTLTYTIGNTTSRWGNIFSNGLLVNNLFTSNIVATVSNLALVYISSDLIPSTNATSNIGSAGMQFNALHARSGSLSTSLSVGSTVSVGTNLTVSGNSSVGANQSIVGNLNVNSATTSTSTTTGAFTLAGGAGIAGNVNIGGSLITPSLTVPSVGSMIMSGNINPGANVLYTLGSTNNRWSNLFSENILVGNVSAANLLVTTSNIAQVFLGADILPTANISSNLGSQGIIFNAIHARTILLNGVLSIQNTGDVSANIGSYQQTTNANIGAYQLFANANIGTIRTNLNTLDANVGSFGTYANTKIGTNTNSNLVVVSTTTSTSTTTGALVVGGGAGVSGNLNVGGAVTTVTMPFGTSNTAVATTAFVQNNSVPPGSLLMWSTGTAPSGYLLCNGNAVSRTTFAGLFAVIGTTFGIGDGTTTFNLPNYNNRFPVGAGNLYALGSTGGSKDSTVDSHTHSLSSTVVRGVATTSTLVDSSIEGSSANVITSITPNIGTVNVSTTGSSGTDANMPPYLGIQFIIKT